jgi:two-component sensor histidine kinase
MGLVHDKLAQSEHLTKVDFAEYIHTLCIHLFASYGVRLDAIHLKIDVDAVTLKSSGDNRQNRLHRVRI